MDLYVYTFISGYLDFIDVLCRLHLHCTRRVVKQAEAVAAKAVKENREALEMEKMAAADDPKKAILVPFVWKCFHTTSPRRDSI